MTAIEEYNRHSTYPSAIEEYNRHTTYPPASAVGMH